MAAWLWRWPNLALNLYPDGMNIERWEPISVEYSDATGNKLEHKDDRLIRMAAETLTLGRVRSAEESQRFLATITRECRRLTHMIDNVLDFAKIERGMGVYEFAEADLGEVIDRAIELSARRVTAADMTLEAVGYGAGTRDPGGALANLGLLLVSGALVGALFLAVLLVIEVWRYSPIGGSGMASGFCGTSWPCACLHLSR